MDTGGEKSDNDIMMESTTSDSGKKVFFYCFTKERPNFDHSLNFWHVELSFIFLIQVNLDLRYPMHFSFIESSHI